MTEQQVSQMRDMVFAYIMQAVDEQDDTDPAERFKIAVEVAVGVLHMASVEILLSVDENAPEDEVREYLKPASDYVKTSTRVPDAWETIQKIWLR